ncbi:MAG: ABC transporter ATP-binding protein [Thermomicrobiales bacterium]
MQQLEAPPTSTAVTDTRKPLIKVENLEVEFPTDLGTVHAVNGVNFQIMPGQTLGVVGESGCGKSVTARAILRILRDPGRITNGTITYTRPRSVSQSSLAEDIETEGTTIDLTALDPRGKTIRSIRGNDIAMIFQEPMTSLSPVHTIGNQICEAILLHRDVTKKDAALIAEELLTRVGVPNARQRLDDYPHQFSGGMRQRAMIAMALSCQPSLLIADEPTTALDVTTEAQILELIREIQQDTGMAVMLITHNLGVVAEMAEEVIVMYLGKVVERTDVVSLFYDPQHPYTQALLSSIPRIGRRVEDLEVITGSVPDPTNIPHGCPFHTRCKEFEGGRCDVEVPQLREISKGHWVSCLHR